MTTILAHVSPLESLKNNRYQIAHIYLSCFIFLCVSFYSSLCLSLKEIAISSYLLLFVHPTTWKQLKERVFSLLSFEVFHSLMKTREGKIKLRLLTFPVLLTVHCLMTLIVEPPEYLNHLGATNTQEAGWVFYLITTGYNSKSCWGKCTVDINNSNHYLRVHISSCSTLQT